jgi:hypothetical protein
LNFTIKEMDNVFVHAVKAISNKLLAVNIKRENSVNIKTAENDKQK